MSTLEHSFGDSLKIEAVGAVRIVTMRGSGPYNAATAEMHSALAGVWRFLHADRAARVVILTGQEKAFCAGAHFGWISELHQDRDLIEFTAEETNEILLEMLRFPLPIIAAVNGPAVGMGCSIAIMTDIVLLADNAHLADPHVSVGLVAGDGGAAMWPLLASVLRAKEYIYTGDRIPPAEAVAMGLATRVVPRDQLHIEAHALAQRLAAQPARALQDTKRTLNVYLWQAAAGAFQTGHAAERMTLGSEEAKAIMAQHAKTARS
jgi:enoyl-CoA hydratase